MNATWKKKKNKNYYYYYYYPPLITLNSSPLSQTPLNLTEKLNKI